MVKKDPTKNLIKNLYELLVRWKKREYITDITYKKLNCTDRVLPRPYGVPKIHKLGCPLRIILSSTNISLYELIAFLHNIIYSSIPTAASHINNSFQLFEKLTNIHIQEEFKSISLNVVSLFTNIPVDLAMDSIKKRWSFIEGKCIIPCDEFLAAVRFVLDSTFFMFNDVFYRQTFSTSMGFPLSPTLHYKIWK